jgi:hypothetical protein
VSKNIKKLIKPRKQKKNNRKNRTVKKTRLNRFKILKNRPVRFYKSETEKTKPNKTKSKTKKTEPNQAKPEKNRARLKKPSQTSLNRFLF